MTALSTGTTPDPVAATPRLGIRPRVLSDAVEDYEWRRDPDLARHDAASPVTVPFEEFQRQFDRDLRTVNYTREAFAIDVAGAGHIGNVMYYDLDHAAGTVEFGITIGSAEHQDMGLGFESTVAFLRYIWRTLPVQRVYLHTLEWNARAQRCFEKAGFVPTARVKRRENVFIRMEARREYWLLWDGHGRFDRS